MIPGVSVVRFVRGWRNWWGEVHCADIGCFVREIQSGLCAGMIGWLEEESLAECGSSRARVVLKLQGIVSNGVLYGLRQDRRVNTDDKMRNPPTRLVAIGGGRLRVTRLFVSCETGGTDGGRYSA